MPLPPLHIQAIYTDFYTLSYIRFIKGRGWGGTPPATPQAELPGRSLSQQALTF